MKSILDNDERVRCVSCGMVTHVRGGDTEGWKAVQLGEPEDGMDWYCSKTACQHTFDGVVAAKVRELRTAQGLPPDPPPQPPQERPRHPLAEEGSGRVLGVPPGGFEAIERRQAPQDEEGAITPQDKIVGSGRRSSGGDERPRRRRNVPEE